MNRTFDSEPIGVTEWILILGVGVLIYAVVGIEKWLRRGMLLVLIRCRDRMHALCMRGSSWMTRSSINCTLLDAIAFQMIFD